MSDTKIKYLWVALIIKHDLKNNEDKGVPDLCFLKANNREDAAKQIEEFEWPDELWVKGKSRSVINRLEKFTDLAERKYIPEDWKDAPEPKASSKKSAKRKRQPTSKRKRQPVRRSVE